VFGADSDNRKKLKKNPLCGIFDFFVLFFIFLFLILGQGQGGSRGPGDRISPRRLLNPLPGHTASTDTEMPGIFWESSIPTVGRPFDVRNRRWEMAELRFEKIFAF
jgi:hypothetical protein